MSPFVLCVAKKHWRHRQMFQTHTFAFIHIKVGLIFPEKASSLWSHSQKNMRNHKPKDTEYYTFGGNETKGKISSEIKPPFSRESCYQKSKIKL